VKVSNTFLQEYQSIPRPRSKATGINFQSHNPNCTRKTTSRVEGKKVEQICSARWISHHASAKKEIHRSWLPEISRQHTRLQRQLEEEKKSTTRRTARSAQLEENISTTSSTAAYHARGLIIACSRKLSATLGGSTSTRPGVRKITLKTYDFIDISKATIPTALGGSTTTSPPIVIVVLRQQFDYVIIDYNAPTAPHPIKAKFSSSKSQLSFTFATPDTRGLRCEISSCISLTSKNCESPSSWRSLSNT
jgi:hypothetical protein